MALNEMRVGYVSSATEGTVVTSRATRFAEQATQAAHGDYMDAALNKKLFFATANGVTSTVGLATTYTGLCVSNPIGSLVNLAIYRVSIAQSVINAAVNALGYGAGYSATTNVTHTTAVTPRSTFFGTGPTPIALADSSATLPVAPVYIEFMTDSGTATTNPPGFIADVRGSLIIPPGGYCMTLSSAASPASALWLSILWEELPL